MIPTPIHITQQPPFFAWAKRAWNFFFYCTLISLAACGSRRTSRTSLTPDQAFSRLKPSSGQNLLCNVIDGYGCGRLSLSTSSGEQSVTHEDFLVSCKFNDMGLSVVARDQAGTGPGLAFGVSVAGVATMSGEKFVCAGVQLSNDPVLAKWQAKTCGVFVRYGETESWTIAEEPCTTSFEQVDGQWRGVVDCPRLSNGVQAWNFNEPAVFTCPK